jgi:NAD+ synthase (glutamine-hydrolysing)
VGAQDELIFDGQSFAMNSSGEIVAFGKSFAEDIIFVDIEDSQAVLVSDACEEEQIYNALTLGLKDYFNKTGHSKGIIGLSGGIDSALTCAIAANGLGAENVIGVAMPSQFSSDHSISDAELLANNLGINFETIPIQKLNAQFLNDLDSIFSGIESGLAEENLQARIRGNLLMAIANKKNALVLNTGNKTESALGYCTMYGDMCGALAVISDLNKSQVYSVCRWINEHFGKEVIPEGTLTKPPSAELSPNQVDPFDYDVVSPLVDAIVTDDLHPVGLANAGFDPELATEMMRKVRYSEYKRRQAPPGIRISKKAFGVGRRYPIVNGYTE